MGSLILRSLMLSLMLTLGSAAAPAQSPNATIHGLVLHADNGSALPATAVEMLRIGTGPSTRRTTRTDAEGRFLLVAPSGTQQVLVVRRAGFRPESLSVRLTSDTAVAIWLRPLGNVLDSVRVRARVTGVDGYVLSRATFDLVPDVRVSVAGTRRVTLSDTGGYFRFADLPAGPTMLVASPPGGGSVMRPVDIDANTMARTTILLDPADSRPRAAIEDMQQRLTWRRMTSALVTGDALAKRGGISVTGLQTVPAVIKAGIRITEPVCVFRNGRPMPGWSLNAFAAEDIVAVEVYAAGAEGSGQLRNAWPPGVACGDDNDTRTNSTHHAEASTWVVIWTR